MPTVPTPDEGPEFLYEKFETEPAPRLRAIASYAHELADYLDDEGYDTLAEVPSEERPQRESGELDMSDISPGGAGGYSPDSVGGFLGGISDRLLADLQNAGRERVRQGDGCTTKVEADSHVSVFAFGQQPTAERMGQRGFEPRTSRLSAERST